MLYEDILVIDTRRERRHYVEFIESYLTKIKSIGKYKGFATFIS